MSKQIIAYGATVERSTDGITYTEIPECKGIAVPMVETEYLDATSLDSPNGFREFAPGLKDAGIISVPCGYTSAGYVQQLADQTTGLAGNAIFYRTTLKPNSVQTTGDAFTFRGFPTPQVEGSDVAGLVGMTISIRVTGGVTHVAGTLA